MKQTVGMDGIRKGQTIRWEAGKGLVLSNGAVAHEYVALHDKHGYTHSGEYFVIEHAPFVMPTEPGAYRSSTGSLWVLTGDGRWLDFSVWGGGENSFAAHNSYYHPLVKIEGLG